MYRYIAEWIIDMDDEGTDKDATSIHPTYDEAVKAAVSGSKKANVIEWVRVREQKKHRDGYWQTVARWHGDWDHMESDQ